MAASTKSLGNLAAESTVFFLCDMQEKFKPAIQYFSDIVEVSKRLYPKGLGSTVSDLDITHAVGVFPKTKFSMVLPPVEEELQKRPNVKSVVLFGIEAHVCVQQTALDLLAKGLDVHVVADACSSRSMMDRQFAYERLRQAGVIVTTSEAVIFQLLGESKHPKFKEVQALVKAVAPVSGLTPNL
ncbi:isochorismatase domain-containing protein 1-like isoform X2 [Acanthaster planci]|uniref:Isochorismatase domain-containing protein 1 n=1 Tax=Acanthaster planci TaxID=133434 RepID=A0A8B7ZXR0_ACAPL|nr:isochorismatase domain-containing protein 1-like isoform X2 [Acanthaster planci]